MRRAFSWTVSGGESEAAAAAEDSELVEVFTAEDVDEGRSATASFFGLRPGFCLVAGGGLLESGRSLSEGWALGSAETGGSSGFRLEYGGGLRITFS